MSDVPTGTPIEGNAGGLRFQVTVDCADPVALAWFWARAVRYVEQPPPDGFSSWAAFADSVGMPADERNNVFALVDPAGVGPRMLFLKVPEGKTAKNRLHLDVNVGGTLESDDRRNAVRRHAAALQDAGGTLIEERQDGYSWWIVMNDPEGNEFCVQ